jgi:hypothetical protein
VQDENLRLAEPRLHVLAGAVDGDGVLEHARMSRDADEPEEFGAAARGCRGGLVASTTEAARSGPAPAARGRGCRRPAVGSPS